MKKALVFVVCLLGFLTFSISAFASTAYNERWTCLNLSYPSADKTIPAIPPVDESQYNGSSYQKYTHSGMVATKGVQKDNPLPNSDTYVVECLQIPITLQVSEEAKKRYGNKVPKEVCTTGDSKVDMYIWNNDRLTMLNALFPTLNYRFIGYYKTDFVTLIDPESSLKMVKTNKDGNFALGKFALVSFTSGGFDRKLMGYNRFLKNPNPPVAGQGGQQQGDLEFDFDSANKNCVKIAWDPYGTVFDTQTLEPVPGATVALYINRQGIFSLVDNGDVPGGFIQNPYNTKEDGYFNFIVPDGTYRLGVAAPNYTFPSTQTALPSNASVIYSDIYKGEDIVQKGAMQHRDVPIDPKIMSASPKFPAKLIGLFQTTQPDGKTTIDGRVSHPYARINAYCKTIAGTKSTLNTTTQANKNGQFSLVFTPSKCNENEGQMYAILEVEAIDLTRSLTVHNVFDRLLAWIIGKKDVRAAMIPAAYNLDPILNTLQGYAMTDDNIPIPHATVGVYATGDINPIQEVKAEVTGRFFMANSILPKGPYELKYKDVLGATTSVSTSKFIAQNISAIQKEKINLYAQQDMFAFVSTASSQTTSTQSVPKSSNILNTSDTAPSSLNQKIAVGNMQNNAVKNQIIIMVMIIFLIVVGGGIIVVYMIKKQRATPTF